MAQKQVNTKTKISTIVKKSKKSDLWFYVINIAGQEVGDYPITD